MNYRVEIAVVDGKGYTKDGDRQHATIPGLPDIYIHFVHHNYDIVWNPETKNQEIVYGVDKYFGGQMGEGGSYKTWQEALLASLYDLYQCEDGFKEGDFFVATYEGVTEWFECTGCEVIPVERTAEDVL